MKYKIVDDKKSACNIYINMLWQYYKYKGINKMNNIKQEEIKKTLTETVILVQEVEEGSGIGKF